ncbi:MAG TPA: glycoside hydrolase family 57 protein [Burkholderiales bacterium]|nr:glycoside hydrolase family 57 protein [Burkholderiales bacterium]
MAHRLDLVLMWHMHQPDYRDYVSGEFTQPWVYLHALKDYSDMAAHLERHRNMRAVVNLVPVLLDQIEDYAEQFAAGEVRDPLLRLLRRDEGTSLSENERQFIVDTCFNANHEKMVVPYPAYQRLHDLLASLERHHPDAVLYLSDRYYYDLIVWYHLAWTGETVRRNAEIVTQLISIGMAFTQQQRLALYNLIGEIVSGIIPRYAALAQSGRVELSATPHFHPLAPLLLDFSSAREARPSFPLPTARTYPGGQARVRFHVEAAMDSHTKRFGKKPEGVWPAEGAVSTAFLNLLGDMGCRWTASSEGVLANSLRSGAEAPVDSEHWLYQPWKLRSGGPVVFFRDDRLSDLIGFEYAKWHSRDAALNFMAELEAIAEKVGNEDSVKPPLVSVILDGENCWEYYPYNGFYFVEALYAALEMHERIRSTTFAEVVNTRSHMPASLDKLVAGSWVHGDFGTWIGSAEKNKAWDLLVEAKHCFDLVIESGRLNEEEVQAAARQLASCESSDWFWWLGDYNPAEAVARFDQLYRDNLARLYRLLKLPEPHVLTQALSKGSGTPEAGGAMRRAN